MSRSRKLKKYLRTFEFTRKDGSRVIYVTQTAREARLEWNADKASKSEYWFVDPAHGVKYHIPNGSYWAYKGRRQLPRDYYSNRVSRLRPAVGSWWIRSNRLRKKWAKENEQISKQQTQEETHSV